MTTTALTRIAQATGYDQAQVQLVKDTIARGASDDELMLFLHLAQRSGLDPFSRQIYLIERRMNVNGEWKTSRQPQTAIDGLRLIADRTDRYAPGREPSYTYDADGRLLKATAYVKKFVRGEWHEIAASAHYDEYVQRKKDGNPNQMWSEKPHIMLAKCAEALAIRRAFPAELSGLYTGDEIRDESAPLAVVNTVTGEIIDPPKQLAAKPGQIEEAPLPPITAAERAATNGERPTSDRYDAPRPEQTPDLVARLKELIGQARVAKVALPASARQTVNRMDNEALYTAIRELETALDVEPVTKEPAL